MNSRQLWQKSLDEIQISMSKIHDAYLGGACLLSDQDDHWIILVSTAEAAHTLNTGLSRLLAKTVRAIAQRHVTLAFVDATACLEDPRLAPLLVATAHDQQCKDGSPTYLSLEALAEHLPPIEWLWPSWIPRGMLTLLGASPGAGKSLVALDLCRRIIHGIGFPDGQPVSKPGSTCIYVDAEAVPQITNQRAKAWKMDRKHLYLMLPPDTYGMLDLGDLTHQNHLIDMAFYLEPELIVIDSLSSISARGENNVEDVRALLGYLTSVAREFNAGLVLVHHLRKRNATPLTDLVTPDDFRGSSHIIAMARSVLAMSIIQDAPEPNRNGPRRVEIVKTNLCQYPKALGLILEPTSPGAPTLRYTDPPEPYKETTQAEECEGWLIQVLDDAGEPLAPRDVVALAADVGFRETTVRRARRALDDVIVNTERHATSPKNRWALAEWGTPTE